MPESLQYRSSGLEMSRIEATDAAASGRIPASKNVPLDAGRGGDDGTGSFKDKIPKSVDVTIPS